MHRAKAAGLACALLLGVILMLALTSGVVAQEVPPAPYAGLVNPFEWSDAAAISAGGLVYGQSCAPCHGAAGAGIPAVNFGTEAFATGLQAAPDFYFWRVSEGNLSQGMPPFKALLTEAKRWQALTYIASLGAPQPEPEPDEVLVLQLDAPGRTAAGEAVEFSARLLDDQGAPVAGATVEFFLKLDFFVNGMAQIGEAETDEQGVARVSYGPRQSGDIAVLARHRAGGGAVFEAAGTIEVTDESGPFYLPSAGLHADLPLPGLVFPAGVIDAPDPLGTAPRTVLRIPSGMPLLAFAAYLSAVLLVWSFYIRVMYNVWRISGGVQPRSPGSGAVSVNVRLLPTFLLGFVTVVITVLVLILITGPYSHPHLGH